MKLKIYRRRVPWSNFIPYSLSILKNYTREIKKLNETRKLKPYRRHDPRHRRRSCCCARCCVGYDLRRCVDAFLPLLSLPLSVANRRRRYCCCCYYYCCCCCAERNGNVGRRRCCDDVASRCSRPRDVAVVDDVVSCCCCPREGRRVFWRLLCRWCLTV